MQVRDQTTVPAGRAAGARATPPPRRPRRAPGGQRLLAVAFLLPAVLLVGVLVYLPAVRVLWESLHATALFSPSPRFVGLEQYQELLRTPTFWQVVRNSLVWTGAVVALQNATGLAAAVLLNQRLPLRRLTRSVVLLPWVLPGIVGAVLWRFMYDPQLGLVNALLAAAGVISENVAWLGEASTAMAAVVVAATWKGFPFSAVVYLAALQAVSRDQVEAALIDGAGAWQRFWHVTIPAISPIIRLNLLLTTIFTFNYFDLIWVATKGGPLNSTHIFPTFIFQLGFGEFQYGRAAACAVVAALMLAVVVILYLRELRPGERV